MPVLNPKRLLTMGGQMTLLARLVGAEIDGPFHNLKLWLVSAAEVSPDTRTITDLTLAGRGLAPGVVMTMAAAGVVSDTGKAYRTSQVVTATADDDPDPVTVVGVLLGSDGTKETAMAYAQLDDPITVDEEGERIVFALEFGFDGQDFYVAPRVLPMGA